MKILIVEDEFASRKLLQIHMSEYGDCFTAINGEEAIEAVKQSILEKSPYDLVCMDIMMPKVTGIEAVEAIRKIEAANGIHGLDGVKIIMTTAKGLPGDIVGAFRAGCEGYIIKPIRKQNLITELEKLGISAPANASS
ncbi:MAG: response regulator [Planctomycetota bacterium]|jgi:two-component system chemotaxis response regulator CheY